MKNKLIVILGPTACGKTKIAVQMASKYNGEIVSADSRQVYRGMDIGTGKDLGEYKIDGKKIPYHLIDVVSPMTDFNVAKYQKLAYKAIDGILSRGKTPFLVGGTGLYIDAVTKGFTLSKLRITNYELRELRKKLDKLTLNQLLARLKKIDLPTYAIIDKKNRRRVQRAVEIYYETGQTKSAQAIMQTPPYEILLIGINFPLAKIYQKIDARLSDRLDEGMVFEVKKLRSRGVSWKRLEAFGLEYRSVSRYLQNKINREELVDGLKNDIHHFAKRQLTWFKRDENIHWVTGATGANKIIKEFIKKRP